MNSKLFELEGCGGPQTTALARVSCEEIAWGDEPHYEVTAPSAVKFTKRSSGKSHWTLTIWGNDEELVSQWGWGFGVFPREFEELPIESCTSGEYLYSLSFTLSEHQIIESLVTHRIFFLLDHGMGKEFRGIRGGVMGHARMMARATLANWETYNPY